MGIRSQSLWTSKPLVYGPIVMFVWGGWRGRGQTFKNFSLKPMALFLLLFESCIIQKFVMRASERAHLEVMLLSPVICTVKQSLVQTFQLNLDIRQVFSSSFFKEQ